MRSLVGVGPVMMIAGAVAAMGFFSLVVFDIATIRTFGIFTGVGILSAVILEMTFIPAVRSLLPAPSERDRRQETKERIWDRIPSWIAEIVIPRAARARMFAVIAVLTAGSAIAMHSIVIDNSSKNFFGSWLDIQRDDDFLNSKTGGTNSLYIMVEGRTRRDQEPAGAGCIEKTQRFAEEQPFVGKTLSIVDFLKRMNLAMNGDDPAFNILPNDQELISQYFSSIRSPATPATSTPMSTTITAPPRWSSC